jgi:Uri superfamily endonuclease
LKGIYVLIIRLDRGVTANIGALGEMTFPEGLYAYVGSAQANLEKRVQRHLRKEKRMFWHIDYLLDNEAAKVVEVLVRQAGKAEECTVANEIGKKGVAIAGFGCSDCRCRSHLFQVESHFSHEFMQLLSFEKFTFKET